jgi:hypothetical protein
MQELLLGSWGPQIAATTQQYPWRVFAAVLVLVLLLDMMFRRTRGTGGDADIGGWDFDGDGGGCGDKRCCGCRHALRRHPEVLAVFGEPRRMAANASSDPSRRRASARLLRMTARAWRR